MILSNELGRANPDLFLLHFLSKNVGRPAGSMNGFCVIMQNRLVFIRFLLSLYTFPHRFKLEAYENTTPPLWGRANL